MTLQQQFQSGLAQHQAGRLAEAEKIYRRILTQQPDHVDALNLLGLLALQTGRSDAAEELIRQAIRLKPDYAEAYGNLGNVFKADGKLDEAIAAYEQAIRLKPDLAGAHGNLGNVLKAQGRFDEAIAACRHALRINPDEASAHAHLLLTLNYHPDLEAETILAEHRAWADRHARPLMSERIHHPNEPAPNRRLRIGYVSADFRRHPVGYFLTALLEHHDRRNLEVFCYAGVQVPDDMTERMKRSCEVWRSIFGLGDEVVANLVRSDGIDILVDLSGHTGGNRLLVFARRPAPIQVTYLGYASTTGMTAMDYRLTDALADPPGMTDHLNVEKLWRLPVCAWCYEPPEDAPDIQPRREGPITFGCFNAFAKINHKMVAMWADLLKRVPGSRLLLKSAGAGEVSARHRLGEQFAHRGISSDRLEMLGKIADLRGHLQLYGRLDVALDTFPYHGTTTTCEALWMGVPVVTLAGATHVSRVGVSLLTSAGFPELVAQTPEEYMFIASELAANRSRLDNLRAGMRSRLRSSPLIDGARFAADVEDAYRGMWRKWCAVTIKSASV